MWKMLNFAGINIS